MKTAAGHRWFARSRDEGAAAIEFVILLPVFLMLTFGMITSGIALWHKLGVSQGARTAARYGATLPIAAAAPAPVGEVSMADWLNAVGDAAASGAGWSTLADVPTQDSGFICVAYVAGAGDTSLATTRIMWGVPRGSDNLPVGSCLSDGRTDSRVQVVVRRDTDFNAILFGTTIELRSSTDMSYERGSA